MSESQIGERSPPHHTRNENEEIPLSHQSTAATSNRDNHDQTGQIRMSPLTPIQVLCQTPILRVMSRQQRPGHETTLQQAQSQWRELFQRQSGPIPLPDLGARPIVLSMANQRMNEVWGDPLKEKQLDDTRVNAMNVNGLRLDRLGGQFDIQCQVQKEVQADIFCGQEHNLDSDKTQVRSILYETARQHWKKSRMQFGTTPISFASMYKPDGTHMISQGDITGRIIHQESDKWGRWVSQTFRGQAERSITIISAYQVVGKPTIPGCITAASQQQSLLLQSQDVTSNPRTAFRRDLLQFLKSSIAKGRDILLVGDFNEPFGSDPDGMEKIAAELQLVDLMSSRHSSGPPATYARGRTRLDYALSTAHVAAALTTAGYEPFNERFNTDHRAYFMDFNAVRLFGKPTQTLGSPAPRILNSTHIPQVTTYLKAKYDLLLAKNAFARVVQLDQPGNRHAFAERLDKDIVAASLAAESKLKPCGEAAWSQALIEARRLVTILSMSLTMIRTGLDHTRQIQKYLELSNNTTYIAPSTRMECNQRLRGAKQVVDEMKKGTRR
jgi:exonuclease III